MKTARIIGIMLCAVVFSPLATAQDYNPPNDMILCVYTNSNQGRNRGQWKKEKCSTRVEDLYVVEFLETGWTNATEIIYKRFTLWEQEETLVLIVFNWDENIEIRYRLDSEYKR